MSFKDLILTGLLFIISWAIVIYSGIGIHTLLQHICLLR